MSKRSSTSLLVLLSLQIGCLNAFADTTLFSQGSFVQSQKLALLNSLTKIATNPAGDTSTMSSQNDTSSDTAPITLSATLKKTLENNYRSSYDPVQGGWGKSDKKCMDGFSVEKAVRLAQHGDTQAKQMALHTLDQGRYLIDPVWGGVYQYSTGGVWINPHPEKLMSVQVTALRAYALAYSQWKRPEDLKAAQQIAHYMLSFLRDEKTGAFFVSQDATVKAGVNSQSYFKLSDSERRQQGIPKVNDHIYARETGWAIEALSDHYQMTQDDDSLEAALKAAVWTMTHRRRSDGGYFHENPLTSKDVPLIPLYLSDNLAMGQAFLSLYTSTGDKSWLLEALNAANLIEARFKIDNEVGYSSTEVSKTKELSHVDRDENLQLTRWASLLGQISGMKKPKQMAKTALKAIAENSALAETGSPALALLADEESQKSALHVTVIGPKSDPVALRLFRAAINYPTYFKRIDWWDQTEGPLLNPDVIYPPRKKPTAYINMDQQSSLPIIDPLTMRARIDQLNQPSTQSAKEGKVHAN